MEHMRLEALRSYQILDTGPHPSFDAITEAVSLAFDVPMAAISLIDEERQWFKAAVGIDSTETDRKTSFCTHTILGEEPMIVEDAAADPRFAENPNVTGPMSIRFYAGMPLVDHEGFALGALCLLDNRPRSLDAGQIRLLNSFAQCVMTAITAHHQGVLLRRAARALELEAAREPAFI